MFQKLENAILWLDSWENEIIKDVEEIKKEKSEEIDREMIKEFEKHKDIALKKVKLDKLKLQEIEKKYKSKIDACKRKCLSRETSEGLRVTLRSTIDLCKYLLKSCNFEYVLTSKLNQDCLEVK